MTSKNPRDMLGALVSARPFLKPRDEGYVIARIVAYLTAVNSFVLSTGEVVHHYACRLLETADGRCCRQHIDFYSDPKHDAALRAIDEQGSWDTAWPIDWLMDVQRVLGDDYKPFGGHVVWHYPRDRGICGGAVGICSWAQGLIDEYRRRKGYNR